MSILVYLIGAPGAGKSTAMQQATTGYDRLPMPKDNYPARDALMKHGDLQAIELGNHRPNFPGTDTLPMDVINRAEQYLHHLPEQPRTILAEGTRLANTRFLTTALQTCTGVNLIYLDNPHAPTWRAERAQRLGTTQNEAWARGRETTARNLAHNPPPGVYVTIVRTPEDATATIKEYLART